jgi:hypothetical protein
VRIVPEAPLIAIGTFDSATFSRIRLPPVAGCEVEECAVRKPMGVFVMLLSIKVRRWPQTLAELVREGDRKVYEEFPTDVPVLICNGSEDRLVPASYTAPWIEKRRKNGLIPEGDDNLKLFVQENTGHSCTKEMVAMIVVWIGDIFKS